MNTAGDNTACRRPRTLLLVDDEEAVLASLKRLLRREDYRILAATGGEEGLRLLAEQPVDVILSDQRMPQMTGVEFLRRVKVAYPETVRLVLSGYTELQSITDAINEGAIYKFLTKPWDDEQLRSNIQEAFAHKELADENRRLSDELAAANAQLRNLLAEKQRQSQRDQTVLGIVQEILQQLPLPVVGLDNEGLIVCANRQAAAVLGGGRPLVGLPAGEALPAGLHGLVDGGDGETIWRQGSDCWCVRCCTLGIDRMPRGRLLILSRADEA